MKKAILFATMMLFAAMVFVGCAQEPEPTPANPFVGTWQCVDGTDLGVMIFTETTFSGTLSENNVPTLVYSGTYTYSGNTATLTFVSAGETEVMSITITNNQFELEGGIYTKQ